MVGLDDGDKAIVEDPAFDRFIKERFKGCPFLDTRMQGRFVHQMSYGYCDPVRTNPGTIRKKEEPDLRRF